MKPLTCRAAVHAASDQSTLFSDNASKELTPTGHTKESEWGSVLH